MLSRPAPRNAGRDGYLLPPPRQQPSPQGRQHRRLRHALGRRLRPHDRPRRRQRNERRSAGIAGAKHGGRPGSRHHPEPAFAAQPVDAVRAHDPVRWAHLWSGGRRRAGPVARARWQLLGSQCHHPHTRLCRSRGASRTGGTQTLRRSCPQSRLRRSGTAPPRRLGCLHAAAARWVLRRDTSHPDRSGRTRPALGPGKSTACQAAANQGTALGEPCPPHPGHHVLPGLAALAHASGRRPRPRLHRTIHRAELLPGRFLAFPGLAGLRPGTRTASPDDNGRRALPAEGSGPCVGASGS